MKTARSAARAISVRFRNRAKNPAIAEGRARRGQELRSSIADRWQPPKVTQSRVALVPRTSSSAVIFKTSDFERASEVVVRTEQRI
eukprot:6966339-Pyramimonas_sp.AAC.1